jgi:hypothetical protein
MGGGSMLKIAFLSMLLASTAGLADSWENYIGNAYHGGEGKVYHDGDFVEFGLEFESKCFDNHTDSWNHVTTNVNAVLSWLDQERISLSSGILDHQVETINSWRRDNENYATNNDCAGKYFTSQSVKIKLHKADGSSLSNDYIQAFHEQLESLVWSLNRNHNNNALAQVNTKVNNIQKGIYDETADQIRRDAKALALKKATEDFKYFLGAEYRGRWYLQSVDFREGNDFSNNRLYVSAAIPPVYELGSTHVPSVLKLEPLSFSVNGTFHFIYDIRHRSWN